MTRTPRGSARDLREAKDRDSSGARTKRISVDCSTLTDLHASSHESEVEIISLLGEDLPKYKLKADVLSQFGGVGHADFEASTLVTPVLSESEAKRARGLTPEQAGATLDYFVSCGDRLSQMTKTYHDVEAVTRLLEEKEKDLELAAKIGQELLERNRFLEEKVGTTSTK